MKIHPNQSLTLIELLISIALLGIVVLTLASIDLFSRSHLITSSRLSVLQNEVSYALEHMSKEISRAIGNEAINGADSVVRITINPNDVRMRLYIDASGNGQRETSITNPAANQDHFIVYRYDATGAPSNQIRYCGRCQNDNCNIPAQCLVPAEILSRNITNFVPIEQDNFATITLTACWDPTQTAALCGTPDNPSVTMSNRIEMPSVSTN